MRIATVNVNGIRAAARKGMGEWLAASAPDILLLQEVRADEQIAVDLLPGYEAAIWPCRPRGGPGGAARVPVLTSLIFSVSASASFWVVFVAGAFFAADFFSARCQNRRISYHSQSCD